MKNDTARTKQKSGSERKRPTEATRMNAQDIALDMISKAISIRV
jgi:hypothetical protein